MVQHEDATGASGVVAARDSPGAPQGPQLLLPSRIPPEGTRSEPPMMRPVECVSCLHGNSKNSNKSPALQR